MQSILKVAKLNISIQEESVDGNIKFNLVGEDINLFTQSGGRLIDAMQHIVSKFNYRNKESMGSMRIILDAEDYRKEREKFIEQLAYKASNIVKKTNQPYILNPLKPSERRLIHLSIEEKTDLKSESLGEGFYKKIKIFKKNSTA